MKQKKQSQRGSGRILCTAALAEFKAFAKCTFWTFDFPTPKICKELPQFFKTEIGNPPSNFIWDIMQLISIE
jgi:hypothetical protein